MTTCQLINKPLIQSYFNQRPTNAHKGMFGHVLVMGGDYGMPGAVRLAAEGALRAGAGLVSVVTHTQHVPIVMSGRPELLCYGVDSDFDILSKLLLTATFIVVGPGLGKSEWSKTLFNAAKNSNVPLLIDADGLTWLSKGDYDRDQQQILTPHPGEAAALLNCSVETIQFDRIKSVKKLQEIYGGVIVLKGEQTLIATSDGLLARCDAGNPGMASAGMGDLLSGIIAGFAAQKLDLWQAAQAGVFSHATAGDSVAAIHGERGILASDLLSFI